jgi:hypothetical protein
MKKYIILISALISIWLTIYFSILPLAWVSQADVSWFYPTTITPAWYTFSIWSIIYISWIVLWIYFIIKNPKAKKKEIFYFSSAVILSAIWLIPWHYEIICVSFSTIFLILWLLFYLIINPPHDKYFKKAIDLYFWWILLATILNFHVFLVFADKYLYWLYLWVISIFLWVFINYYLLKKYSTYISSFVLIWALIWIIIWNQNDYILVSSIIWIFIISSMIIKQHLKNNE